MSVVVAWVRVLLPLLLVAACDVKGPFHVPMTKVPYQRWEAPGRMGPMYGSQNVYWIDDDNVLYVGMEEGKPDMSRVTLRIWKLSTGAIRELGPSVGGLCYFRGYVSYFVDGRRTNEGPLEGPLETIPDRLAHYKWLNSEGYRQHPINCRQYKPTDLAPGEECKVPLLPGDGYLEMQGGRCDEAMQRRIQQLSREAATNPASRAEQTRLDAELAHRPVRYFKQGDDRPIELPIEAMEIPTYGDGIKFVEWRGQYLLPQHKAKGAPHYIGGGDWPLGQGHMLYLLSPTGELETIAVDITKVFRALPHEIAITRGGVIARAPLQTQDRKQALLGLVLYRDGGVEQLDDEHSPQMALSPNGCRVGYEKRVLTGDRADPVLIRLRVIDLCRRND